jgi:class 3 adenylate cyclase/tetratricopeptide (TPR) repeat protein
MFADLVGSTPLATRLEAEDLREVLASFYSCVASAVSHLGGFVAKHAGDGVLIYFGYPQAHENDAELAIRAGLLIVDAVCRLGSIAGPPGTLDTRVGIATGSVVVGDLIGAGSSLEVAVVGEIPNLASRLQGVADPGSVVVADTTRQIVGDLFEYRKLEPIKLKGFAAPVQTWVVLGDSKIDSRFEALRPSQLPLVGRTEELQLLLRRWNQAVGGEGRVVLLYGEAGIGKSRLIGEMRQRTRDKSQLFVRFSCTQQHKDTPLQPIIRWMERNANFQRDDSLARKREKLSASLSQIVSDQDTAAFYELLSVSTPANELSPTTSPRRMKEMIFAAFLRQIEYWAGEVPLLAVVEDVHWADPTTLDLLALLVDEVERRRMLLIVAARPELQPSWVTRPQVTVQVLNGLGRQQATTIVKEIAGPRELPDDIIEQIIKRADGVPLFIEELTKTLLERMFEGKESTPRPLSPNMVPVSLQASLMARLDRLAGGKEVAEIGAVIGREFSFELLQMLADIPSDRLEGSLGELVRAGLASARGQPPHASYRFTHALVQDAAYACLLREPRRAIHLRLAELLQKDVNGVALSEPQLIAWHLGEAGAWARSVDYYLKAANRATGRFALIEMVNYLRKGLRQIENLPLSEERLQLELTLQIVLGRVFIDQQGSGSEEVRRTFEHARELCRALNETTRLIQVLDGLINYHFTHSQLSQVLQYASEMTEVSRISGDTQTLTIAHRSAGWAKLLLGRFAQARDELQSAVNIYEAKGDLPISLTTRDARVSTYTALGICLTSLGYPNAGQDKSSEAVRHAENLNHTVSLILGLRRACVQGMLQRDVRTVTDLSGRLRTIADRYDTFLGRRESVIFNCWAQLQSRGDEELLAHMQKCVHDLDTSQHRAMLPFFMASTAEVVGSHGSSNDAAALLVRAAELIDLTDERWCQPEILRLQAVFGVRSSAESISLLQTSLAQAQRQDAKLWELRTATTLARLFCDQGEWAAAREMLAPVYSWFTEGSGTVDLMTAQALLNDISRRRIAESADHLPLSTDHAAVRAPSR